MTFEFHPEALHEYFEAASWYEEQRQQLGVEFVEAVEAGIRTLLNDPGRYQPVGGSSRVFRLKRFPYQLFFRFDEAAEHVRIVGIMHGKRRPDRWHGRD